MACSYYVYYRVDPERSGACALRARELIEAMGRSTGVRGRLLRKRGEPHLWMEVYERVSAPEQFEAELARAVARLRMEEFLVPGTPRHIECFEEPE